MVDRAVVLNPNRTWGEPRWGQGKCLHNMPQEYGDEILFVEFYRCIDEARACLWNELLRDCFESKQRFDMVKILANAAAELLQYFYPHYPYYAGHQTVRREKKLARAQLAYDNLVAEVKEEEGEEGAA